MNDLIVRASESYKMMTKSRTKSDPLGETTKTWLKEKAVQEVLGYRPDISNKYMDKGIKMEGANSEDTGTSMELLHTVYFESYKKHEGRVTKDGFSGECDILHKGVVRDIKSSWSIDTFPFFEEDAEKLIKKSGYDWQVRVYMMLYNVDVAYIDYCLVSTPIDLIGYEDEEKHIVDHIEPSKRVTSVMIKRDENIDKDIKDKYILCNEQYKKYVEQLKNK